MEIKVKQQVLYKAINAVQKIVANRNQLDITSGILIEANNNSVKMTSTNIDLIVENVFECEVLKSGSIVIDGKLFLNLIRSIPVNEYVNIVTEETITTIKCGSLIFNISSKCSGTYPKIHNSDVRHSFKMSAHMLKSMIKQVVFSVGECDFINNMNGVLLNSNGDSISLVYLDRYRLAMKKLRITCSNEISVVIPQKTLIELSKIIDVYTEEMEVKISENTITFYFDNITFISKLISGNFIDYKKAIPNEVKTKLILEKKKLQESLERAALITNENNISAVKFRISAEGLLVIANSKIGGLEEKINCEVYGDVLDIAFNTKYLLDGLKVVDSDFIEMYFTSKLNPCMIKALTDEENYLYLTVPVNFK